MEKWYLYTPFWIRERINSILFIRSTSYIWRYKVEIKEKIICHENTNHRKELGIRQAITKECCLMTRQLVHCQALLLLIRSKNSSKYTKIRKIVARDGQIHHHSSGF
jgi:hypothetical protein